LTAKHYVTIREALDERDRANLRSDDLIPLGIQGSPTE
jgi:hypothetical protein